MMLQHELISNLIRDHQFLSALFSGVILDGRSVKNQTSNFPFLSFLLFHTQFLILYEPHFYVLAVPLTIPQALQKRFKSSTWLYKTFTDHNLNICLHFDRVKSFLGQVGAKGQNWQIVKINNKLLALV